MLDEKKKKPRIIVVTGDGKGKTTSAMGLALRAGGHGMKVRVLQFIKNSPTGEMRAFSHIPGVEIEQFGNGFVRSKTGDEFDSHKLAAQTCWKNAVAALTCGDYKVVVLDEICCAVKAGLLCESEVVQILTEIEKEMCVVLTGRGAGEKLMAIADTVSEIKCIKHGMNSGVRAQRGVEF